MNGMKTEMPDSFYYDFYMLLWKMTNYVLYARDTGHYLDLSDEEKEEIDATISDARRVLEQYKKK